MKPIVLATDGSPSAAEATLRAVELARTLRAPLVAVSVEHIVVPGYGYYARTAFVDEMTKIEHEHVEETLEQTCAVATAAGVECVAVHATGPAPDAICLTAVERGAEMIVIGAHGWSPIRRVLHGSVSTAVVHSAHCPVLVVRGGPESVDQTTTLREAKVAS